MDEEQMVAGPMPPAPQTIGISLSTIAGEFLLFLGLLFIMLGAASFLTDRLGIAGIGEAIVGIVLVAGASALIYRSMRQVRRVRRRLVPQGPLGIKPQKKEESDNTASYR